MIEIRAVVELVEQCYVEVNVSCCIHEVSAGALEFGPPDLDGHGFGEYLVSEFALSCRCCRGVLLVVVENVCSLTGFSEQCHARK